MTTVLISTYELGRQPFGLASPAAWLRSRGHPVSCFDLSREPLLEDVIRRALLVAFYVPMHTATRLAVEILPAIRAMNPQAHLCFYGLYAPVNEAWLRKLGVQTILGGEYEQGLRHLAMRIASGREEASQPEPVISLARQKFLVPDRSGLVPLEHYARLQMPGGEQRVVGYTEASRGCKHLCRHCPIVPVYRGAFRIIDREIVLADIRQQVAAGAQHLTFGDPDFFNGIGHAIPLIEALHAEFPRLSYDVTIKVEHLLRHERFLKTLRDTGCLFVTSAVESVDDAVLERLDKGHTREDFLAVVRRFRTLGLSLQPTFIPFTPWTTVEGYLGLLEILRENDLMENVAPIQLAIRLLIPAGSRLLEREGVSALAGAFDESAMVHPWKHEEPRIDQLCKEVGRIVDGGEQSQESRARIFGRIELAARRAAGGRNTAKPQPAPLARAALPYVNEPWYC